MIVRMIRRAGEVASCVRCLPELLQLQMDLDVEDAERNEQFERRLATLEEQLATLGEQLTGLDAITRELYIGDELNETTTDRKTT